MQITSHHCQHYPPVIESCFWQFDEDEIAVSPANMDTTAIFFSVTDYGILFFAFAFFLNGFHLTFSYELIVGTKTTGFVQIIGDF